MEGLLAASDNLASALHQYINACRAVTNMPCRLNGVDSGSRNFFQVITRELHVMDAFELELKTARSLIAQRRNTARIVSPMNTLPENILQHIFETVYHSNRCSIYYKYDFGASERKRTHFLLPDTLSHVCTRWRKIALRMFSLWTHIDLTTSSFDLFQNLLGRGEVLANRVGSRELTLHIDISYETSFQPWSITEHKQLGTFYSIVGPRTQFLELSSHSTRELFHIFLERSLLYATPGVLQKLIIEDSIGRSSSFISPIYRTMPPHNSTDSTYFLLIPAYFLNEILRPVTFLKMKHVFFRWGSLAYTGLTSLHLLIGHLENKHNISITRWELADIFMSSPALHSFHFNLPIDSQANRVLSDVPVLLRELEELYIPGMKIDQYEELLSLISLGSKPLKLSVSTKLDGYSTSGSILPSSVSDFLKRTNALLSELYLSEDRDAPQGSPAIKPTFPEILAGLPIGPSGLRVLGLNGCGLGVTRPKNGFASTPQARHRIDTLYLEHCFTSAVVLQELARAYPIRVLLTGNAPIESDSSDDPEIDLTAVFPRVERVDSSGLELEMWGG